MQQDFQRASWDMCVFLKSSLSVTQDVPLFGLVKLQLGLEEMGKGHILRGETVWTQGVLTNQQADQSGQRKTLGKELGEPLERWT